MAAATLSEADVDSVRLVDGRIDLELIGVLERQLTELQAAVDELADTVEDADDPWLVAPVRERLTDLSGDLVARQQQGEDALLALRTAPSLLGADEPKVYLVAFVTPVEARGSIGFLGNVAELTPGQMMEMTMKCHQFLFQAELTSNVANRTSDGIQQLFRQQS